jgi:DNA-binding transcriptional regulator PaaX
MPDADCEGDTDELARALIQTCVKGGLTPADMRAAFYLCLAGYVAPRYADAGARERLAEELGMNAEWLRKALVRLVERGIAVRERGDDRFWRYALNPSYRYERSTP